MKEVATTKTKKTLIQRASQKSDAIIKSRDLNEAHFPDFGLNEYRLYSLVLSKVIKFDKTDEKNFIRYFFETHIVTPREFSEIFKVPINHCYKILKNSSESLIKKTITTKSSSGEQYITICSMAKYNTEKHHLEMRLSHEIIPHIDITTRYVKSRLYEIADFKSVYSIELYELIAGFKALGRCRISIEELNFVLGIKKIEYGDFKTRILIPSVNAINKIYPKLKLEFTEIKTGRKVTEIEFAFKKSRTTELTTNKTSKLIAQEEDIGTRLVKLGVDRKVVQKYSKCSDEKLNIAYEKLIYQMKTVVVQNPTGYFIKLMDVDK